MFKTWEAWERQGAMRRACLACGAHTLVTGAPSRAACSCCGSRDLTSVTAAEARRAGERLRQRGVMSRVALRPIAGRAR